MDSDKEETQVIVGDEQGTPSQAAVSALHSIPKGPEMSATAIARLMGIATSTELKLLEGKLDVIITRLNALTGKVEKNHSMLARTPTGSDLERIDVHIGALKKLFADFLASQGFKPQAAKGGDEQPQKEKPTS